MSPAFFPFPKTRSTHPPHTHTNTKHPPNIPSPCGSVGSPRTRQGGSLVRSPTQAIFFPGGDEVIATGCTCISLSPFSVARESSHWLGKVVCGAGKKLKESMDRCAGHRAITEIILKMALNSIRISE